MGFKVLTAPSQLRKQACGYFIFFKTLVFLCNGMEVSDQWWNAHVKASSSSSSILTAPTPSVYDWSWAAAALPSSRDPPSTVWADVWCGLRSGERGGRPSSAQTLSLSDQVARARRSRNRSYPPFYSAVSWNTTHKCYVHHIHNTLCKRRRSRPCVHAFLHNSLHLNTYT